MRLIFQFSFFLVLLIGGIFLGTQNSVEIDVIFFGKEFEAKPLWMIMLMSFAAGAGVSLVFCSFEILRAWQKIFVMKRQLKSGSGELPSSSFEEGAEHSTDDPDDTIAEAPNKVIVSEPEKDA